MTTATDHSFSRKWLAALAAGSITLSGLFGLATPAAAEELPADETVQVIEAPTQEIVVQDAPAEDVPAEDAPAEDAPTEDAPAEDAPAEEAPADEGAAETPVQEAPAEAPVEEAPAQDAVEAPAEDAARVVAPAVTVTPATDVDTTVANAFTVSGTNFVGDGAANGVYVLLGPASTWSGGTPLPGTGWVAQIHVPAASFVDGAFTGTLNVPAGTLDPAVSYVVATSAAHALSFSNRTLDTITPITVKPAVVPPAVTVTPATNIDTTVANSIAVSGSNFVGPGAANGAYVLLGPASTWSGGTPLPSAGWTAQIHVPASSFVDGAFTGTLNVPAGTLDPAVSYVVATSAAHMLSFTNRTLDTITPITLKPAVVAPNVTVSKVTDLDRAGETVTVSGTGFLPSAPATNGARPPLMGQFSGAYVVFGKFLDAWKPSAGAASSSRVVYEQKWALGTAQLATAGTSGVEIAADGSWSTTLTVSATEARDLAAGNYGIYTYPGSGAVHAPFETYTPLTFTPPVVTPQVTVSKVTGLDRAGETITVSGTGFLPSAPATNGARPPLMGQFSGAYVVFGKFLDAWKPSAGAASSSRVVYEQKWALGTAQLATGGSSGVEIAADGSWSTTLTVSATEARDLAAGNYGIYTYPGSGAVHAPFETYTPLAFTQPVVTPAVTVSKVTGLDRAGETVTVSGTGFLPSAPATNGARPPLMGQFSGAYVVFGKFLDAWKPSAGAASSSRVVYEQKWALGTAQLATAGSSGVEIAADGSWSTTLTVSATEARDLAAGNYGIYTYPGSGAVHAPFETYTPIAFAAAPVAKPSVTVSPSTNIDTTVANALTVSGTNFVGPGAANGAYVLLGPASTWTGGSPLPGEGWTAQIHVPASAIVNGAFTGTLNVPAGTLDPAVSYVVATSAAHGLSVSNRTLDTITPITLKPVVVVPGAPRVTVSPSKNIDTTVANSIAVSGTNFVGPGAANGAYVLIGPASTWSGGTPLPGNGWTAQIHVPASSIVNGAFTGTLNVPAGTLDPSVSYIVATSAAHGLSLSNRSLDTITRITLKPITVPNPNPTLTLGVSPSSLNATIANTVTVTGSGYTGPGAANGVYVNFGAASTWQPGQVPGAGNWVVSQHVPASSVVNGSFTTTLTIPANTLVAGQNYGVATFAAHALSVTNRTLDKWTPVVVLNPGTPTEPTEPTNPTEPTEPTNPTNPEEPANPNPNLSLGVTPSTLDATVDNVLTVTGSGYTGPGAANGVYVNLGALSVWQPGEVPGDGAWIASVHVPASQVVNGEWSTTLTIPANSLVSGERYGVATFAAHQLSLTDRTLDKWTAVTVTNPVAPTNPSNPTNPGTPTTPTNPSNPTAPAGASLSLGVNPSSVNAGVANTFTISGSGYTGAGAANGVYVNIGSSSVWQPGQVPGEGSWIASRHIPASGIVNGSWSITITVPANTFKSGESYGAATFAAHALSITNRSLDAWAPISLGGGITTASAVQQLVTTPAETPPATTGITVIGAPVEGQKLSAEAQGFQSNEKGILVVLYSDPIVLGTVDADADGVARWSGNLPFGLSGKHTLTFQGSINQGAEIEITAAEVIGCPVDGATLTWGFKETFRSYISGSIANGEWVVANGASYETPAFGWNNGVGGYDPETGEGHVGFTGSIQFTGHSGALDTTVANPQIKFVDADTAMLLLDVTGVTQTGETINELGVEFVELDVSGAELADGVLTIADAPAVLTDAGAAAFGTYPAGEAFDAVSLSIPLTDCGEQAVAAPDAEEQDGGTAEVASADAPNLWWILWVALALVLAAIVVTLVVGARRKGNAAE